MVCREMRDRLRDSRYWDDAVRSVCCTRCMPYSVYAVLGVCCMLYSQVLSLDHCMERLRGMT